MKVSELQETHNTGHVAHTEYVRWWRKTEVVLQYPKVKLNDVLMKKIERRVDEKHERETSLEFLLNSFERQNEMDLAREDRKSQTRKKSLS